MLDIRKIVDEFLADTGMAPSTFGRRVMGDKNLVKRLRLGKDVTTKTAGKIIVFVEAHRQSRAA